MRDQRDMPECLNRRYEAVDQLINELNAVLSDNSLNLNLPKPGDSDKDPGLKLMCDFWSILKEDPSCDLPKEVQQRMCTYPSFSKPPSEFTHPRSYTCYMAQEDRKPKKICPENSCCSSTPKGSAHNASNDSSVPLNKVLCNLKEAASFDKRCGVRLNELLKTEKFLQSQIQVLEARESAGAKLLKQADCMWSCMEDAYKQKIANSLDRQREFSRQLREVENSKNKWRKNKKDLESQLDSINKCHLEITDKINQKTNDIKCMDMEIEGLKKRNEDNKKNAEAAKKSLASKKKASEARIASIASEIKSLQKEIEDNDQIKKSKHNEAEQFVKDARQDLQNLCRVLLQKKLENEDLAAEKIAIIHEIKLLEATLDGCKERCKKKQETIYEDIRKVEIEIANYKVKCIQCHQCVDTNDIRKFCTDCPRCLAGRDCVYSEGHCDADHTTHCVCQTVKTKFLDNIFDNMYTVLERQIHSGAGHAVADSVLKCLKKSRNGKLDAVTKEIIQDFVLTTVKRNLNLTIVGGAVKTRCEMDPETYKLLMLCLKKVTATKPAKDDKGIDAKKDPCKRWSGASECFCPKGPKDCVCGKKAPRPPDDPTPCPKDPQDEANMLVCPHKDGVKCGADCGMHSQPLTGADLGKWRPDPCQGPSCAYNKNTRAARLVLADSTTETAQSYKTATSNDPTKSYKTQTPVTPDLSILGQIVCKCGKSIKESCTCEKDRKSQPRRKIIEEVMGQYLEVPLIEKVRERGSSFNESLSVVMSESDDTDESFNAEGIDSKYNDESVSDMSNVYRENEINSQFSINQQRESPEGYIIAPILVSKPDLLKSSKKAKNKSKNRNENIQLKVRKNEKVNEAIKDILKTDAKRLKADPDTGDEMFSYYELENVTKTNYEPKKISDKIKTQSEKKNAKVNEPRKDADMTQLQSEKYAEVIESKKEADMTQFQSEKYAEGNEPKKETYKTQIQSEEYAEDDIKMVSEQNDVFDTSLKENGTDPYVEVAKWPTVNINNISELRTTHSGTLIMNLSEELIDKYLIKDKLETNDVYVALLKTDSGRIFVEFAPDPTTTCLLNLNVHRSRSGKITLEINKNFIKSLHDSIRVSDLRPSLSIEIIQSEKTRSNRELDECNHIKGADTISEHNRHLRDYLEDIIYMEDKKFYSSTNVCGKTKPCFGCKNDDRLNLSSYNKDIAHSKVTSKGTISTENLKAYTTKSLENYQEEFLKIYECEGGKIRLKVRGENDMSGSIDASITKTPSGHIALDVRNLNSLGEIPNRDGEHPILLKRSLSGKYSLYIGQNSKSPNTVLRRTSSNGALVVITEPVLKSMALEKKCFRSMDANQSFKVQIKGVTDDDDDVLEPPALLKLTPSGNYILVLDKEYERQHSNMVNSSLFKDTQCYVELERISSSTVLINFEENCADKSDVKTHALVLKSSSDNIKILVNGPIFDNLQLPVNESDSKKALSELLSKIPYYRTSEKGRKKSEGRKNKRKSEDKGSVKIRQGKERIVDIKSSSDTQLYENVRMKLIHRDGLLSVPSAALKKTSSGQFTVFLDKGSKKAFINDVKSFLANSSQTTIPVKRTDTGEITIDMTGEDKAQRPYERLKITPSGNIFIILDEKTLKRMESAYSDGSVPLKEPIKKAELNDQSSATFCNAKPEECICIPDKCICREVLENTEYDPTRYQFLLKTMPCNKLKLTPLQCKEKDCDPGKCQYSCCQRKQNLHLFMPRVEADISSEGPLDSDPNRTASKSSNKSKMYFFSCVEHCPFKAKTNSSTTHDTTINVPSARSESSWPTLNDGAQDYVTEDNGTAREQYWDSTLVEDNLTTRYEYWDSTSFLEHQLPSFLRDVTTKQV